MLQQLEEHAAEVNAAGGAGTWESGGGAYAAFLWLKVSAMQGPGRVWSNVPSVCTRAHAHV